jgi:hypothetical protein
LRLCQVEALGGVEEENEIVISSGCYQEVAVATSADTVVEVAHKGPNAGPERVSCQVGASSKGEGQDRDNDFGVCPDNQRGHYATSACDGQLVPDNT